MPVTIRSTAIEDAILERLAKGEPLEWICRDDGMPNPSTVWRWGDADEVFSQAIAHARELGGDAIAADALRIADTPLEGVTMTEDADGFRKVTADMLGHRKLQVETRLKLLAKWHPKRYGDKIGLTGPDGNGPMQLAVTVGFIAGNALPATSSE